MVLCPVTRDENPLIQYCRAIMQAQKSLNLIQSILVGWSRSNGQTTLNTWTTQTAQFSWIVSSS